MGQEPDFKRWGRSIAALTSDKKAMYRVYYASACISMLTIVALALIFGKTFAGGLVVGAILGVAMLVSISLSEVFLEEAKKEKAQVDKGIAEIETYANAEEED